MKLLERYTYLALIGLLSVFGWLVWSQAVNTYVMLGEWRRGPFLYEPYVLDEYCVHEWQNERRLDYGIKAY